MRKARGWKTGELAARCGLTENIIENIESGRRGPDGRRRREVTVDELAAIAAALGVRSVLLLASDPSEPVADPDVVRELRDAALVLLSSGISTTPAMVQSTAAMLRTMAVELAKVRDQAMREAAG